MKQHYCLLERFNNYFNRKIIKYESLSDYEDHAKDSFIPYNEDGSMTLFDFNPADNVTTEIIVNNVPFDPDYFLLLDDNAQIVQRWFVLEQKRNRQGQWVYYLRRDVVADNFNNLLNAPIFVQKGMLHDNDPFIFNSEGMSFNQIKKNENLIKDKSQVSWVVCYLAKSLSSSNIDVKTPATEIPVEYVTLSQIASELNISESQLASALNLDPSDTNNLTITDSLKMNYVYHDGILYFYSVSFDLTPDFSSYYNRNRGASGFVSNPLFDSAGGYIYSTTNFENNIIAKASSLVYEMPAFLNRGYYLAGQSAREVLNRYNGKIILYLGNYYTLNVSYGGSSTTNKTFKASDYPTWNEICYKTEQETQNTTFNPNVGEATLDVEDVACRLELTSYTPATIKNEVTISSARKVCQGQEFDVVAIPAGNITIQGNGYSFIHQGELAQRIASALAIQEGSNIYDVQLLPYCPRPDLVFDNNVLDIIDSIEDTDFSFIEYVEGNTRTNVGVVLYLDKASFTSRIDYNLIVTEGKKIDSQCNFYRLNSPNYQGSFEFNLAKNGGSIEYFNIYCTYKPYTPFIKVTPNLKDLYGNDYNDNRGLICGGDFSLPRASSAWQQYQLENKNYQNIFNREIQNMNFMQSIEMRNQLISGAVGIISDTAKGAGAGAYSGGVAGAIAGGILGGATSAIGFGVDVDTLARTQREQRQLAIDKYNYQLGNIKALPYTLTKVGAFDISSKIFPFLEYYTCTDKEKDALREKIKYESMTVMRIGTINEFKDFDGKKNYFKGELIRNDEIADDSHILNAIYEELLKGVYI